MRGLFVCVHTTHSLNSDCSILSYFTIFLPFYYTQTVEKDCDDDNVQHSNSHLLFIHSPLLASTRCIFSFNR